MQNPINLAYERLVNEGKVGIRFLPDGRRDLFSEKRSGDMAHGVLFVVDDKVHRGFRDQSGRFTLEQCNLAKANEADNLQEWPEGDIPPESFFGMTKCENCWPNEPKAAADE